MQPQTRNLPTDDTELLALRALVVGILAEEADDDIGEIQEFANAAAGENAAVRERVDAIIADALKAAESLADEDEASDEDEAAEDEE